MGRDRVDEGLPAACAHARRLASDALDAELAGDDRRELDGHLDRCAACRVFDGEMSRVRSQLRVAAVAGVPPIADRVLSTLAEGRAEAVGEPRGGPAASSASVRSIVAAAAVTFLVAAAVGALAATLTSPREAVADIPARVLAAQADVVALSADVTVMEQGWHPDVPVRIHEGVLSYRAPERLALELVDRTEYPSGEWVPNDVVDVVDEDTAWSSGPAPCPVPALPACTPRTPRDAAIVDRAPFAGGDAPLDAVVPVASFAGAAAPDVLGNRSVDGHDAVGVEVTVAQVRPLLDAFTRTGNWREMHGTDRAEVWLHEERLVPLEVVVRAGDSADRARWAIARGYDDEPGSTILTVELTDAAFDEDARRFDPPAPAPDALDDGGFVPTDPTGLTIPEPAELPVGMSAHRAGIVAAGVGPTVEVRSWSDGRAWIRLRAARDWEGGRLFGDLGGGVRPVELPGGAGLAYVGEGGQRIALHGGDVDVVIDGTVASEVLLAVTASLGIVGAPVPDDWAEAATATVADAQVAFPGLLLPVDVEGFDEPTVRVVDGDVAMTFPGPGARAFVLTQSPGTTLTPPLDADVRGVELRGRTARYTPGRGELEWVEDGTVVSLRSRTLSLSELIAIAGRLRPADTTGSDPS